MPLLLNLIDYKYNNKNKMYSFFLKKLYKNSFTLKMELIFKKSLNSNL